MAAINSWPRHRIADLTRQTVLDAAADLQVRRREIAAALAGGETDAGQIVARGLEDTNDWMMRASAECSELLSVRPTGTAQQVRTSLPNNRAEVARGMRMTSVFDHDGLDPVARLLLSGEADDGYLFGVAPVQMKIFDGERLVLQGPFVDGEMTVMTVSSPDCLALARTYWTAVLDSSSPASEAVLGLDHLTGRQRQVVALLATDAKDDSIADALGVSVRTVRSDVADVLELLGVRSRFAAGVRVHQQVSAGTAP